MAMRYLVTKIGVPALRRASGPRLPQPAGTPRRLSSSSHQGGGHDNGARKPMTDADVARLKPMTDADVARLKPMTDADVARLKAEFAAECEAVRKAFKQEEMCSVLKACLAGVGLGLLATWYSTYVELERAKAFKAMFNQ